MGNHYRALKHRSCKNFHFENITPGCCAENGQKGILLAGNSGEAAVRLGWGLALQREQGAGREAGGLEMVWEAPFQIGYEVGL